MKRFNLLIAVVICIVAASVASASTGTPWCGDYANEDCECVRSSCLDECYAAGPPTYGCLSTCSKVYQQCLDFVRAPV